MIITSLDWYPKEFRAGDADGKINESLMGKPELSPLEILIRETAQNSWDARLAGQTPQFSISLRKIPAKQLGLSTLMPMTSLDTEFHEVMISDEIDVIEIADRNTTGLDGPVDMGPVDESEVSKNFEDLIYKVGVPRQDGKGGGTYGFGKTATYGFSRIGTVIFWTRCINEIGELEHRFIISCFRPQYIEGDKQYTGRHWWGKRDSEKDHILPVRGEEAQFLGETLFQRHFGAEETGTSLLILSPKLETLSAGMNHDPGTELAQVPESMNSLFKSLSKEAIREHLWPKLVPIPGHDDSPIKIQLYVDDEEVPVIEEEDPYLHLWGKTLNHIREAERYIGVSPTPDSSLISTRVLEVTYKRSLIGYLAISQFLRTENNGSRDILNPGRKIGRRLNRIALMREQAELIVTNVDWFTLPDEEMFDWVAVFRSTAEFDPLYAESEPPAHDSWNSKTERDEVRLLINHTARKVTELLTLVLQPVTENGNYDSSSITRTAKVAARLSSLLPAPPQQGLETNPSNPKRNSKNRGLGAEKSVLLSIRSQAYLGFYDGKQIQRINFVLSGAASTALVWLKVSIVGEDSAIEHIPGEELATVWENSAQVQSPNSAVYRKMHEGSVVFKAPPRVALRISLTAEGTK